MYYYEDHTLSCCLFYSQHSTSWLHNRVPLFNKDFNISKHIQTLYFYASSLILNRCVYVIHVAYVWIIMYIQIVHQKAKDLVKYEVLHASSTVKSKLL